MAEPELGADPRPVYEGTSDGRQERGDVVVVDEVDERRADNVRGGLRQEALDTGADPFNPPIRVQDTYR